MIVSFVSPTNLHCSQTIALVFPLLLRLFPLRIYTALKHSFLDRYKIFVCFPYEFTLLSNHIPKFPCSENVCCPYEFTLLSNLNCAMVRSPFVCFPYKFTLLSNIRNNIEELHCVCFPYKFTLLSNNNRSCG